MNQNIFIKNERRSRRNALFLTILIHLLIIGLFISTSSNGWMQIQEWLGITPVDNVVSLL